VSVFSDQRVIDALKDFVSVVQDTSLQNHPDNDELSKFFRSAIQNAPHLVMQNVTDFSFAGVKPSGHGVTTQGLYTFDAAGKSYGGLNTNNNVDDVLKVLENTKRRFDADPPAKLENIEYVASSVPTLPEGAVIARTFTRIRPIPLGCSTLNNMVGRDHLWILSQELDVLRNGYLPETLARRIVRHHLVDNIRGEPGKWRRNQIKELEFSSTIDESGDEVRVSIAGEFSMLAKAGFDLSPAGDPLQERGYKGTFEAEVVCSGADGELQEFQFLAEGLHWGVSKNNASSVPDGEFPLKVAIVLAKDGLSRTVPPHGMRRWRSNQENYYGMSLEDALGD